jgi:hypothetical protein
MTPGPRLISAFSAIVAVAALAGSAEARPAARAKKRHAPTGCAEAHRSGEEQLVLHHLIDASHSFAVCARTSCGAFLSRQCRKRGAQVDLDIPTIVPLATDGGGAALVDVQVTMDGQPLLSRLDGRAVSLDPGLHDFVFTDARGQSAKQQLVVVQGQRNRQVSASLGDKPRTLDTADVFETQTALPRAAAPADAAAPAVAPVIASEDPPSAEPAPRHRSIGPWLLTGLGLAGLGGYGVLTHWGRQDNDALAGCAPNCRPETMRHIRMLYLGADVSAGVGAAALVGAATWFLLRSGPTSNERASRRSHYAIDVRPTPSGAVALVSGGF